MTTYRIVPPARPADNAQHAKFAVESGRARMAAEVTVTSTGIVAIGALVSSILLSTAAIVWVAQRRTREDDA
jgi:hypothetical protein